MLIENAPEDEENLVKLPMAAEIPFAGRNDTRAVRKNDSALRLARIDRQPNTPHGDNFANLIRPATNVGAFKSLKRGADNEPQLQDAGPSAGDAMLHLSQDS